MSDAAITAVIAGTVNIIGMLLGFLTLWVKLKYGVDKAEEAVARATETATKTEEKVARVEEKIDTNTKITKTGLLQSTIAASSANETKEAVESINQKMNGGIDDAIAKAIKPLQDTMQEHILNDEQFMRDIRQGLTELKLRVK